MDYHIIATATATTNSFTNPIILPYLSGILDLSTANFLFQLELYNLINGSSIGYYINQLGDSQISFGTIDEKYLYEGELTFYEANKHKSWNIDAYNALYNG